MKDFGNYSYKITKEYVMEFLELAEELGYTWINGDEKPTEWIPFSEIHPPRKTKNIKVNPVKRKLAVSYEYNEEWVYVRDNYITPTIESVLDLVGTRVGNWMIVPRTSTSVSLAYKDKVFRVFSITSTNKELAYGVLKEIGFKFNLKTETLKEVKEQADRASMPWNPSQGVVYTIIDSGDGEYYKYDFGKTKPLNAEELCIFYTKEDADKWVDKLIRAYNN